MASLKGAKDPTPVRSQGARLGKELAGAIPAALCPMASPSTDQPEIRSTPSGYASLFFRGEFLDDPLDPVTAAQQFVQPARLQDAKVVVLFGTGLGYRMASMRDSGARVMVYEPSRQIFDMLNEHVPAALEGIEAFTERPALQARLLHATMAGQKTVLLVPPAYKRAFPDEHAALLATMQEAEGLKRIRMNTLKERFRLILETALSNLPKLKDIPLFSALGEPLAGTPAFIISAGPSLDKNGELLELASKKGALFTVNTAAPAVVGHGAKIDVLTSIEALDVTQSLNPSAAHATALALDLSSAAANFNMSTANKLAFMAPSDPFHDFAASLSSRALPYGASVATAAFALAKEFGANPIVMVGQDLAYTGGKVYATGTGREHTRATLIGNNNFDMTYDDHMLETFRLKGVPAPNTRRPAVEVPAWGGGVTHTTHDMVLFLRWFETAALDQGVRKINATEGGARLEGFEEMTLSSFLKDLPDRSDSLEEALATPETGADKVEALRSDIVTQARAVAKAAKKCLEARNPKQQRKADAAFQAAKKKSKAVELHATPDLLRLREDVSLTPAARRKATFSFIQASAERVAQLVDS